MINEVIGSCPICNSELAVTKLECSHCHTRIEGNFGLCKFCKLSHEQKEFVEIFLKSRGNIKEIEKELGISYPTVRGRLDDIIRALGYEAKKEKNSMNKKEILERLNAGEISSDEALKLLRRGDSYNE